MNGNRYLVSGADIIKTFRSLAAQGKTHYKEREKRIGHSDPHIRQICRHYFGQTSGEVFKDIMMDTIRDFVMHSNWSIEEIAFWFNISYRHLNVEYQRVYGEKMGVTRHRAEVVLYKTKMRPATNRFDLSAEGLESVVHDAVISGEWKVANIARRIGCSTVTLQQKSKLLKGQDISSIVAGVKAEITRDFIMNSNLSIYDISLKLGCERRNLSFLYANKYGETVGETRARIGSQAKKVKGVRGVSTVSAYRSIA